MDNKIYIFFDGQCGLCRREINHYKRIAPRDQFSFIDITQDQALFKQLGLTIEDGLKLLHVQTSDGVIHRGVDAFIVIWQQLPYWHYLARMASFPMIKPILSLFYRIFAHWRYKRLGYGCHLD